MELSPPNKAKRKPPDRFSLDSGIQARYPRCSALIGSDVLGQVLAHGSIDVPEAFPDLLADEATRFDLLPFLPDLARLEKARYETASQPAVSPPPAGPIRVNPSLQLIRVSWHRLVDLLDAQDPDPSGPRPGDEWVLIWKHPSGKLLARVATPLDLLLLKMTAEEIPAERIAREGNLAIGTLDAAVDHAVAEGILLSPPPQLRRDGGGFPTQGVDDEVLTASIFTLQWHITQACDLHCRHCYDRSSRLVMTLEQALEVLDDLRDFCRHRHVRGQVSFTGGNPLLHPHFLEIYRAAAERGFALAILGNPASRAWIERIVDIQAPEFYQVSLEGMEAHNDYIRGTGHFRSVVEFLDLLRDLHVYSMVMLTLTRDNMDQVIPLAEFLRGRTPDFHFNRLSMVGEGAALRLPDPGEYADFLETYLDAARKNPVMGLKDNLFNIVLHRRGEPLFGGCTGYGCGAAFNFLALLPDGEVHACRKFPSLIGNVSEQSLAEIYDSEAARRYRNGPALCRNCSIRPVCGGCMASVYSHGLDVFHARDPYCFHREAPFLPWQGKVR